MEKLPTRITLTRNTGFTAEVARALAELAAVAHRDPRELAGELLAEAIKLEAERRSIGALLAWLKGATDATEM